VLTLLLLQLQVGVALCMAHVLEGVQVGGVEHVVASVAERRSVLVLAHQQLGLVHGGRGGFNMLKIQILHVEIAQIRLRLVLRPMRRLRLMGGRYEHLLPSQVHGLV